MSKLSKGLFQDVRPEDQPENTYRFAKNAVLNNELFIMENEKGFENINVSIPYTPIGVIVIEDSFVVFSTDNVNSEIGLIENDTYTQVYSNTELAFSTGNPIQGEFFKNFRGDRVISWIDDINVPRILNIDDVTDTVNDINDLRLFPFANLPVLSLSVNDQGGALLSGTYQIVLRYTSNDGSRTNWFTVERPIYVNDDGNSGGFDEYDGIPAGTVTTKSINVGMSQLDTRFDFVEIGAIRTINGVVTAVSVRQVPVSSSAVITVYSGNETVTDITLDEILVNEASYVNAKAIGQLNNQLYLGNLTSDDLIDYQQYANNIRIDYNDDQQISNPQSLAGVNSKEGDADVGYQHGEVYAFYIVFVLRDGSLSRAFHIPGRPSVAGETSLSDYRTGGTLNQGLPSQTKVYQVEDTSGAAGAATNMGYWENENETYPNTDEYNSISVGGLDLRGQNVRHHRFPSINALRLIRGNDYGHTTMRRLGINVSNVVIPSEIQAKVQGWRIFYAERTYANSTIIGQTIFQYGATHESATPPAGSEGIMSSGGNWQLNNVGGGSGDEMRIFVDSVRLNSFDLLLQRPSVTPSYITNLVKFTGLSLTTVQDGTSNDSGKIDAGSDSKRYVFVNYFRNATASNVVAGDFVRTIQQPQYVAHNVIDGDFNNTISNETFAASIINGGTLTIAANSTNIANRFSEAGFSEESYLTNINQYRTDVYNDFAFQSLIATDGFQRDITATSFSGIYGGDTFINLASTLVHNPADADDLATGVDTENGFKAVKYFLQETRNNIGLRHENPANTNSFYYPKTDNLLTLLRRYNVNFGRELAYNSDYSVRNDKNPVNVFNPFTEFVTTFPHTIIRSQSSTLEEQENSWRTFLSANRYVMPRNKGEIVNLQGINNDRLLIHHERTLFATRDVARLTTGIGEVTLGSGDLFRIQPQEILSTNEGYAGTQNALSCLLTKAGYFFIDQKQGKVFLYNDKLEEISSYGNRTFFRTFLRDANVQDNPFNGNGLTVCYDEDFNRLIFSKVFPDLSFTVSYNPTLKTWISFHDYIPNYLFNTRDTVCSINEGSVFKHNQEERYGLYYDDQNPASFIVDVVYNNDPYVVKTFKSVDWVTELRDEFGVEDLTQTFDFVTVKSHNKCSGEIELERYVNVNRIYGENLRNTEGVWSFNDFRDILVQNDFQDTFYNDFGVKLNSINEGSNWYDKRRFIDKFVTIRYRFLNKSNIQFRFLNSRVNSIPSYRRI